MQPHQEKLFRLCRTYIILGVSEGGQALLENHNVEEVFEEFAVADEEGLLDRDAFNGCFQFNN